MVSIVSPSSSDSVGPQRVRVATQPRLGCRGEAAECFYVSSCDRDEAWDVHPCCPSCQPRRVAGSRSRATGKVMSPPLSLTCVMMDKRAIIARHDHRAWCVHNHGSTERNDAKLSARRLLHSQDVPLPGSVWRHAAKLRVTALAQGLLAYLPHRFSAAFCMRETGIVVRVLL